MILPFRAGTKVHRSQETAHLPRPPQGPRHISTVGSKVGAVSYERGTLVLIKDTHPHRDAKNAEGLTPLDVAIQVRESECVYVCVSER